MRMNWESSLVKLSFFFAVTEDKGVRDFGEDEAPEDEPLELLESDAGDLALSGDLVELGSFSKVDWAENFLSSCLDIMRGLLTAVLVDNIHASMSCISPHQVILQECFN
jgi:hypothetical protein